MQTNDRAISVLDLPFGGQPPRPTPTRHGVRIEVSDLTRTVRTGRRSTATLLEGVTFAVEPGELVAIVGPSGAGKTTLLEAIAGIEPPTSGTVRHDGIDVAHDRASRRGTLGYVPQDDIVHADLPLARTLHYAARLRLPSSTSAAEIDAAVRDALDATGLTQHAHVRVGSLSGGQRKRASIAAELLTRPHVFFLDEPTSGLDPVTGAGVVARLRELADRSATVVFTTHSVDDLASCDRVVFMARGGHAGYVGTLDDALHHFGVDSVAALYGVLAELGEPARSVHRPAIAPSLPATVGRSATPPVATAPVAPRRPVAGASTQWRVLTRRTLEILVRNRLTLAILIGSPALVVAMLAVLFRPGAFEFHDPSPSSMVMLGFWIVFGAFFFGITYGLLQICTERAILHRERLVGLRLGAYLASKVTVLVPFLALVVVAMLGVLRVLDRLPARSWTTYASIGTGLLLCAIAALALGLLASASVGNVAQATLALPMLCFPAVLFSGAILPVHLMTRAGVAISVAIPSRWSFEALGHDLGAKRIFAHGGSPLGPPLLASYGDAGSWATGAYWLVLAAFTGAFLAATWVVLHRTTRGSTRRRSG